MGRPKKDENREETTLRVLKAAEENFGTHGFEKTRLEDIAEEAGIRRSSLLYHFGSKDALYTKVVDRAFDEILEAMAKALLAPGSYPEKLDILVASLQGTARERQAAVAVVLRELVSPDSSRSAQIVERLTPLINGIEQFANFQLSGTKGDGYPTRAAVLHLIVFHLVRAAAAGPAEEFLGDYDDTKALARVLLL